MMLASMNGLGSKRQNEHAICNLCAALCTCSRSNSWRRRNRIEHLWIYCKRKLVVHLNSRERQRGREGEREGGREGEREGESE